MEGANGPTTNEADLYLFEHGVDILPDVLANGGGVVTSYYEWVQNKEGLYWTEEEVNTRLEQNMKKSFEEVWAMQQTRRVFNPLKIYGRPNGTFRPGVGFDGNHFVDTAYRDMASRLYDLLES